MNQTTQTAIQIEGFIFDFDGTLADTVPICIEAFRRSMKKHQKRDYTDEEIVSLFGPDEEGCIRSVLDENWQDCLQDFYREYEALHATCREPFQGILHLLEELKGQGIRIAVVTAKGRVTAEFSLRFLNLYSFFEIIETGSPQGNRKSTSIQKVQQAWNLPSDRIGYVGDAPSDIDHAREAKVIPISVAWATTANAEELKQKEPDFLFHTVEEFQDWVGEICGHAG